MIKMSVKLSFFLLTTFLIATFLINCSDAKMKNEDEETFSDNDYNPQVGEDTDSDEDTEDKKKSSEPKAALPQNMFFLATAAASKVIKHLNTLQHQFIEWIVNVILPRAFGIHVPKQQVQDMVSFIKNWTWNKLKVTGILDEYLWLLDTFAMFNDNTIM